MSAHLSLAEIADWPADELDEIAWGDIDFPPEQVDEAAAAWCWLMVASSPDEVVSARQQLRTDGGLIAVLHRPIATFLTWFRCTDWEAFGRDDDEATPTFAWAWQVLDRARLAAVHVGPGLAAQLSVMQAIRAYEARRKTPL